MFIGKICLGYFDIHKAVICIIDKSFYEYKNIYALKFFFLP
jgi:hypothetical protein